MNIVEKYNSDQEKAINHNFGTANLIISAGPGTGKTFVIIETLKHLANKKDQVADLSRILITSLTKRTIYEIKHKVQQEYSLAFGIKYLGTMHAIAIKILTKFKSELKKNSNFIFENINIAQDIYSKTPLREWWKNKRKDLKQSTLEEYISFTKIHGYLHWLKNNPTERLWKLYKDENKEHNFIHQKYNNKHEKDYIFCQLKDCFNEYHCKMMEYGWMSFDDVLIWFHQLLIYKYDDHKINKIKKWIQEHFDYIFVDEFQDMNELQLEILKEISGNRKNMFCVGDPNQAIYSFIGAHDGIFDHFKKIYKDQCRSVDLKANRRSNANIVDFSNLSINHNYLGKPVEERIHIACSGPKKPNHHIIFYNSHTTEDTETRIIETIKNIEASGDSLRDIAIIYGNIRSDVNARKMLQCHKIKFIDYEKIKNFEDSNTQFFICCINISCKNDDNFCIEHLLNIYCNKEKIDQDIVEAIKREAGDGSWYHSLMRIKVARNYENSEVNMNRLRVFIKDIEKLWITTSQIKDYMSEMESKINNLLYGRNKHKTYSKMHNKIDWFFKNNNMYGYEADDWIYALNYVKVHIIQPDEGYVHLSTINGVKGSEFKHVLLVGVSQGCLPHKEAIDADIANRINPQEKNKYIIQPSIEEERRKFYVAITRPKEYLYLFHSQNKLRKDETKFFPQKPSVFFNEMNELRKQGKINYFHVIKPDDPIFVHDQEQ